MEFALGDFAPTLDNRSIEDSRAKFRRGSFRIRLNSFKSLVMNCGPLFSARQPPLESAHQPLTISQSPG